VLLIETAIARRKEAFALGHLVWTADGYTVKFRLGGVDIVRTAVGGVRVFVSRILIPGHKSLRTCLTFYRWDGRSSRVNERVTTPMKPARLLLVEDNSDGPAGPLAHPGDYNRAEAGSADQRVWSETGCTCVLLTSTRDVLR
jgi:hypothetical protein